MSGETKWTAGPWRVARWSKNECEIVATVDGKATQITGYCLPANARLIAAAPELYEALAAARLSAAADVEEAGDEESRHHDCRQIFFDRLAVIDAALSKASSS